MNDHQRDLVRGTLEMLRPISKEFGDEFYERLFRLDPSLHVLFSGKTESQAAMFVTALHAAALGLVEDAAVPTWVHQLGARHGGYGARDAHFDTFREALLETLCVRLGAAFTPEVREAWVEAYDALAREMKGAVAGTHQHARAAGF